MERITNKADVIKRIDESINFYADRIKAFKAIEFCTKKDGGEFAVMSKNFAAEKPVYIRIEPHYDGYRLYISYRNIAGRYTEDWIDFNTVTEAKEKIENLIKGDTARMAARIEEKAKAVIITDEIIAKLDEISAILDNAGIEKRNTLRYAIGALLVSREYEI